MGRLRRIGLTDPDDTKAMVNQLSEVVSAVNHIDFGDPQDPASATSTTLAGSSTTAHVGNLQNVHGAWASAAVATADTATKFYHHLGVPVSVANRPNVRWLHFYAEHDGWNGAIVNAATAIGAISCNFQTGDAVTTDYIELRFYVALPRVLAAGHPLRVDLFFTPAVSR